MSDVDLPAAYVRAQVASAVDLVIQMARLRDGRRVVFRVSSVDGLIDGEPAMSDVFAFRPRASAEGVFVGTGVVPPIVRMLEERGERMPSRLFAEGQDL